MLILSLFHYFTRYKEAMRSLLLLSFLLAACQVDPYEADPIHFSGEIAYAHVLQQMEFGFRYPGSHGHALTQDWLTTELNQSGWVVEFQPFEYQGILLTNIIARRTEAETSKRIVLGAHYDTRQFADRDLSDPTQAVPGANDGASGVAVLLELARILPELSTTEVILVFFDGEDQGRIGGWDWAVGSRYFVDHFSQEISAAIIVDMVGDRDLALPYEGSSDAALVQSIWQTAKSLGYPAFKSEPGPALIDDHIAFIQNGIPAVDIIDFDYPYWHTSEDKAEKVSAESLHQVGATLEVWLQDAMTEWIMSTQ
jgi:glutaminyl-peptide cyclotransferase